MIQYISIISIILSAKIWSVFCSQIFRGSNHSKRCSSSPIVSSPRLRASSKALREFRGSVSVFHSTGGSEHSEESVALWVFLLLWPWTWREDPTTPTTTARMRTTATTTTTYNDNIAQRKHYNSTHCLQQGTNRCLLPQT